MTIADALFDAGSGIRECLKEDTKHGYAAPEDLPEIEKLLAEMDALRLKLDGYPSAAEISALQGDPPWDITKYWALTENERAANRARLGLATPADIALLAN